MSTGASEGSSPDRPSVAAVTPHRAGALIGRAALGFSVRRPLVLLVGAVAALAELVGVVSLFGVVVVGLVWRREVDEVAMLALWLAAALPLVVGLVGRAVQIHVVAELLDGRAPSLRSAFAAAARSFWPLLRHRVDISASLLGDRLGGSGSKTHPLLRLSGPYLIVVEGVGRDALEDEAAALSSSAFGETSASLGTVSVVSGLGCLLLLLPVGVARSCVRDGWVTIWALLGAGVVAVGLWLVDRSAIAVAESAVAHAARRGEALVFFRVPLAALAQSDVPRAPIPTIAPPAVPASPAETATGCLFWAAVTLLTPAVVGASLFWMENFRGAGFGGLPFLFLAAFQIPIVASIWVLFAAWIRSLVSRWRSASAEAVGGDSGRG